MILKGYYEKEYLPDVWEGNSWLKDELYCRHFDNNSRKWVLRQIKYT